MQAHIIASVEHVRIDLARQTPFLIGDVEIRPATREVIRGRRTEIVEPRVMQVLVALARTPGAILTRGDLTMQCWDGRVVGEDAINRVISRIRSLARTLGGFRVETVNKVGYRLVEADAAGEAAPSFVRDAKPSRRALIGGGVAALAALGAGLWLAMPEPPSEVEELIRRGRDAMRVGTADQIAQSLALLRLATELEPRNGDAWGTLALGYSNAAFFAGDEALAMRQRSRAAAERALELDPGNPDAEATLALLVPAFGNWAAAERALRSALARQPDHAMLLAKLSWVHSETGRNADAVPWIARAVQLERFTPGMHFSLANAYWAAGRLDEAESAVENALRRWPRYYALWFTKLHMLMYTGRPAQAIDFGEDLDARPPGIPADNFDITLMAARALQTGAAADADRAVALNLEFARRGTGFAQNAAIVAAALGRPDEAFRVLDGYFFNRGMTVPATRFGPEQGRFTPPGRRPHGFLFSEPMAPLRADPRFEALMRETGMDGYWRANRIVPDYRLA